MSITHNKYKNPLLNLLINCISAKSAPQILSIKYEYTFRFSNFLIIGLCYFSTICVFSKITSVLIPVPFYLLEDILLKDL